MQYCLINTLSLAFILTESQIFAIISLWKSLGESSIWILILPFWLYFLNSQDSVRIYLIFWLIVPFFPSILLMIISDSLQYWQWRLKSFSLFLSRLTELFNSFFTTYLLFIIETVTERSFVFQFQFVSVC